MNGPACGSCGAGNPTGAAFCWRCYERFGSGGFARLGSTAAAGAVGMSSVAAAHGGVGVISRATNGFNSADHDPYPKRTARRIPEGLVAKLLLLAVLGGGAWFGYTTFFGQVGMPEDVGGMPRRQDAGATAIEEMVKTEGAKMNVRVQGAAYGDDSAGYLLLVFRKGRWQSAEEFFGGGDAVGAVRRTAAAYDGVTGRATQTEALPGGVVCSSSVATDRTACAWMQGNYAVFLGGVDLPPLEVQLRVPEVRRALDL